MNASQIQELGSPLISLSSWTQIGFSSFNMVIEWYIHALIQLSIYIQSPPLTSRSVVRCLRGGGGRKERARLTDDGGPAFYTASNSILSSGAATNSIWCEGGRFRPMETRILNFVQTSQKPWKIVNPPIPQCSNHSPFSQGYRPSEIDDIGSEKWISSHRPPPSLFT